MAASVYPMILTIVSIFTLLFLFIFVVPAFTQSFFDAGTPLPAMTLILVRFSLLALGQLLACGQQDAAARQELIKIAKGGKSQVV